MVEREPKVVETVKMLVEEIVEMMTSSMTRKSKCLMLQPTKKNLIMIHKTHMLLL